MGASECQGVVGQPTGKGVPDGSERTGVHRVEVHREAVRDDRSVGRAPPLGLHLALDPTEELDGLQPRPEETGRLLLEETFEKPLYGGEWTHTCAQT